MQRSTSAKSSYSRDADFDGLPDELDLPMIIGIVMGMVFQMQKMLILPIVLRWDDKDGVSDERNGKKRRSYFDTDGDGVEDKDDKFHELYYQKDSDNDGLPDALEIMNGTNPNNSDSDGDGYLDAIAASKFDTFRQAADNLDCSLGWERCDQWLYFWRFWDIKYDCDGNGWVSWEEWEGIDPACQNLKPRDEFPNNSLYSADTDRDGDADEIDEDDDNDGFKDIVELNSNVNTDPKDWDSQPEDKDGDTCRCTWKSWCGPFNWDSDGDRSGDGCDWPLDVWDSDKDKLEN